MAFTRFFLYTSLLATFFSGVSPVMADSVRESLLKASDIKSSGAYTRARFVALKEKPFDPADSRKKVLLIGDSQAQDFLNAVMENGYLANYQIRTRFIPFPCQVFLSEAGEQHIKPQSKSLCAEGDNIERAKTQIAEADFVILSSLWEEWAAKLLPETIQNMDLRPDQRLVVIGRKEFGKVAIRKYLAMSETELRTVSNKVSEATPTINTLLRSAVGDASFVDSHKLICGEGTTCRLFTDDLQLISFDGGHLTKAGAKYVGKRLFEGSFLGKL